MSFLIQRISHIWVLFSENSMSFEIIRPCVCELVRMHMRSGWGCACARPMRRRDNKHMRVAIIAADVCRRRQQALAVNEIH